MFSPNDTTKRIAIGLTAGIIGIASIMYIIKKRRNTKDTNDEDKNSDSPNIKGKSEDFPTKSTFYSTKNMEKTLKVTSTVTFEINNKINENETQNQTGKFIIKTESNLTMGSNKVKEEEIKKDVTLSGYKIKKSVKNKLNNSVKDKIKKKVLATTNSRITVSSGDSSSGENGIVKTMIAPKFQSCGSIFNETFLNFKDFGELLKKQNFKDTNHDLSVSLERPLNKEDIHRFEGEAAESELDGYIEDLEEDGAYTSHAENAVKGGIDRKGEQDYKECRQDVTGLSNEPKIILTNEELYEVLYQNTRGKFALNCLEQQINNPKEETLLILHPEHLLLILEYLYSALHAGLIELSDNFVEERRKYFLKDHETYISIIDYFLRKKEEFFLCVLSEVMSRLSISQKTLDSTFFYYMNVADSTQELIKKIKESYDEVYHAGIKYSIAPKVLNKDKLKIILNFQCEIYEEMRGKYSSYQPDVIEIIVTDHVYLEYGYDREAIRAAIDKVNIEEDDEFNDILRRIEMIQNSSFLNI